jgi:hypothetical protein
LFQAISDAEKNKEQSHSRHHVQDQSIELTHIELRWTQILLAGIVW